MIDLEQYTRDRVKILYKQCKELGSTTVLDIQNSTRNFDKIQTHIKSLTSAIDELELMRKEFELEPLQEKDLEK